LARQDEGEVVEKLERFEDAAVVMNPFECFKLERQKQCEEEGAHDTGNHCAVQNGDQVCYPPLSALSLLHTPKPLKVHGQILNAHDYVPRGQGGKSDGTGQEGGAAGSPSCATTTHDGLKPLPSATGKSEEAPEEQAKTEAGGPPDADLKPDATAGVGTGVDTLEARCQLLGLERGAERRRDEGLAVPQEFLCPISRRLMQDPVVAEDTNAYERHMVSARVGEAVAVVRRGLT
jgi:hypothetical protein